MRVTTNAVFVVARGTAIGDGAGSVLISVVVLSTGGCARSMPMAAPPARVMKTP
jgi:hypothetical protein